MKKQLPKRKKTTNNLPVKHQMHVQHLFAALLDALHTIVASFPVVQILS